MELDSHEELDNHLRVQARSRAALSRRVGQSFAGPGEIKRREVSWTLMKSWTIICGSRRDLQEGGGAGPSRVPRRDQEQGSGAGLGKSNNPLLQLFLDSCSANIVFVTVPHSC